MAAIRTVYIGHSVDFWRKLSRNIFDLPGVDSGHRLSVLVSYHRECLYIKFNIQVDLDDDRLAYFDTV